MSDKKVLPHSYEAEQAVLGAILLEGGRVIDQINGRINSRDFYCNVNRFLYAIMVTLHKESKPIDPILVISEVGKSIDIDIEHLYVLANTVPSVTHIMAYVDIVRERSILRELIGVANEVILDQAEGYKDLKQILDETESRVREIQKRC